MDTVTTLTGLQAITVNTVGNFTTNLLMTGQSDIVANGSFAYTADVKIAPITSKINVSWTIPSGTDVADFYRVTGVYIVNAIDKTLLPIIQTNNAITSIITPSVKTAKTGLTGVKRDYDIYNSELSTDLNDENTTTGLSGVYTYYVGENYHNAIPTSRNGGYLFDDDDYNTTHNANTLVVLRISPISGTAPASIMAMGDRYYTFDLNNSITNNAFNYHTTITNPTTWTPANGFSTKRKTNYHVNFTLNDIGTSNPFEQLSHLVVTVTATAWEDAGSTPAGF